MKRISKLNIIFTLLILAGTFGKTGLVFAQDTEKVTVSKVRVFLDDQELLCDEVSIAEGKIKLSTILSYTQLKTEKEYSLEKLEKEIEQTKLRLLNSGLFYNATVEKMKSRKNPGTYIIYINVTTGFLQRFGGGGIYAVFGNAGLHGNREQLLWFLGWNKNGASYKYEHAFNSPLILGADLFTDMPYCFTTEDGINVEGKGTIGAFLTPDVRLCLDAKATYNFKNLNFTDNFVLSPYLSITKIPSEKLFTTTEIRFFYYPLLDWEQMFDTAYTINYSPVKKLTLAALAAGGYSVQSNTHGLSLNRENTALFENLGLANRGIRSGYSDAELNVRGYLMGTLEIRWNAFDFTIPPCFPGMIVPYVFADVAAVEKLGGEKGDVSIMDAYGVGVQINFACPVFAYFNFSYGINHQGKGKFYFTAVQSF